MTVLNSATANFFETTLTNSVGPTDLVFPVTTTANGPVSPAYLVLNPDDPAKREVVLCDSTFDATNFRASAIAKRYLAGSAAGSGLTHGIGTVVRCGPLSQHIIDLHDRVSDLDTRAVLESAFVAKGDVMTATAAGTTARFPVGADGTVLEADSTQALGWKAGDAKVPKSLVTTKGDLIAASASAVVGRLAAGTDNYVLRAKAAASLGVEYALVDTNSLAASLTKGTIVADDAALAALAGATGQVAFTVDKERYWTYSGGGWKFLAGKAPRFRLTGGGAGQSMASGSTVLATWANGTEVEDTEGAIAVGAGVFTCPAAFAGRWQFEYGSQWQANNAGQRMAFLRHSAGPTDHAVNGSPNITSMANDALSGSTSIVLAGGETVGVYMLQNCGAPLTCNSVSSSYFQGRMIGLV